MSANPEFDEEIFKYDVAEYLTYLKAAWAAAIETAEECIGRPAQPDDVEAVWVRRRLVFELSMKIFDKISLDVAELPQHDFWTRELEGKKIARRKRRDAKK